MSTSGGPRFGHFLASGRAARTSSTTSDAGLSNTTGSSMSQFVRRTDCLKSEMLFKVVKSHYSYSSSSDVRTLFSEMFPYSSIAKQFSCGEGKGAYLCNFRKSPYLKGLLKNKVNESSG